MSLLVQFLLRLSFGLAAGMAIPSANRVTSGYYRNHLYVTLGLSCLAALLSYTATPSAFWFAVGAAVASYVGAVCWLYEQPRAGKIMLLAVAGMALTGCLLQSDELEKAKMASGYTARYFPTPAENEVFTAAESKAFAERTDRVSTQAGLLRRLSNVSSGMLLGITMAAMLLGHWYLNSPTMELRPLYQLLVAMAAAVALQTIVSGLGLWGELANLNEINYQWTLFVTLRWLFGLVGVSILIWMAWKTLEIPNTQSATGILYVAVIGTFIGETMALLLSAESLFPL